MLQLSPLVISFFMTILFLAFFFHVLGIYCCLKERKELRNQKIILLNLSCVELLTIFFMVVYLCGNYMDFTLDERDIANGVLCTIYHIVTSLFYFSMILIPVDRLICIISPTKYFVNVRRSTLKKVVALIWFISFTWSIVFAFLPLSLDERAEIILYFSYAAQGVFLATSVCAYVMLAYTQFCRRGLLVEDGDLRVIKAELKRRKKTFLVSLVIISTFVLFYMIPNYIHIVGNYTVDTILIAVTYMGLSADPIVYILLHKALRPIAISLLSRQLCGNSSRLTQRRFSDLGSSIRRSSQDTTLRKFSQDSILRRSSQESINRRASQESINRRASQESINRRASSESINRRASSETVASLLTVYRRRSSSATFLHPMIDHRENSRSQRNLLSPTPRSRTPSGSFTGKENEDPGISSSTPSFTCVKELMQNTTVVITCSKYVCYKETRV